MLEDGNALKGSYKRYVPRLIGKLIEEIPEERRCQLLEEIKARVSIAGCKDECALKAALKHLKK